MTEIAQLSSRIDALRFDLAVLPPGDPGRAALDAQLAEAKDRVDTLLGLAREDVSILQARQYGLEVQVHDLQGDDGDPPDLDAARLSLAGNGTALAQAKADLEAAEDAWARADADAAQPVGPSWNTLTSASMPEADDTPAAGGHSVLLWVAGLLVATMLVVTAIVLLSGDGGDEPEAITAVAGNGEQPAANPEPQAEPVPAAAGRPPTVTTFQAVFDQATFTTHYSVVAIDPEGDPLQYAWEFRPHEDCGLFGDAGPTATWTHPHEDNRPVEGMPDDRYCRTVAPGQQGHPGEVLVAFSDNAFECVLTYDGGSEEGRLTEPQLECQALQPG